MIGRRGIEVSLAVAEAAKTVPRGGRVGLSDHTADAHR